MPKLKITLWLFPLFAFQACTSEDSVLLKQAEALEQRLSVQYTPERSDSLINVYKALVKSNPDDHVNNFKYLTRAAEVQFSLRKEAVAACRWLNDALKNHAEGSDKTEALALLARIWNAHNYKSAATWSLDPKDIDAARAHLQANLGLLDTALIRLDQRMSTNGIVTDAVLAGQFIEISEAYTSLTDSENKYVDLYMRAAGLAKNLDQPNKALQMYFKISDRLPKHAKAPTALFMQGFIYENDLKDLEKARATYESFLSTYPDDPDYADDAKTALSMLGKSAEELVKSFQQQQ
jgi:tetratricopeptide (TPR) repeat protein